MKTRAQTLTQLLDRMYDAHVRAARAIAEARSWHEETRRLIDEMSDELQTVPAPPAQCDVAVTTDGRLA